jgi:hypothetical protein
VIKGSLEGAKWISLKLKNSCSGVVGFAIGVGTTKELAEREQEIRRKRGQKGDESMFEAIRYGKM